MAERMAGVVIALVTSVDDPEGLGRVKLRFPWMAGEPESAWARIAAPMAGPETGFFFQPEVDHEALVAFEHGDINRPYVLGFLWSGQDSPPSDEPLRRVIRTGKGHVITLDDGDGSESITLEDSHGNRIVMDESGITIETGSALTLKGQTVDVEASSQFTGKGNPIHLNP